MTVTRDFKPVAPPSSPAFEYRRPSAAEKKVEFAALWFFNWLEEKIFSQPTAIRLAHKEISTPIPAPEESLFKTAAKVAAFFLSYSILFVADLFYGAAHWVYSAYTELHQLSSKTTSEVEDALLVAMGGKPKAEFQEVMLKIYLQTDKVVEAARRVEGANLKELHQEMNVLRKKLKQEVAQLYHPVQLFQLQEGVFCRIQRDLQRRPCCLKDRGGRVVFRSMSDYILGGFCKQIPRALFQTDHVDLDQWMEHTPEMAGIFDANLKDLFAKRVIQGLIVYAVERDLNQVSPQENVTRFVGRLLENFQLDWHRDRGIAEAEWKVIPEEIRRQIPGEIVRRGSALAEFILKKAAAAGEEFEADFKPVLEECSCQAFHRFEAKFHQRFVQQDLYSPWIPSFEREAKRLLGLKEHIGSFFEQMARTELARMEARKGDAGEVFSKTERMNALGELAERLERGGWIPSAVTFFCSMPEEKTAVKIRRLQEKLLSDLNLYPSAYRKLAEDFQRLQSVYQLDRDLLPEEREKIVELETGLGLALKSLKLPKISLEDQNLIQKHRAKFESILDLVAHARKPMEGAREQYLAAKRQFLQREQTRVVESLP